MRVVHIKIDDELYAKLRKAQTQFPRDCRPNIDAHCADVIRSEVRRMEKKLAWRTAAKKKQRHKVRKR